MMMDMYSRLEELRLDEKRRRPMTPDQMMHFYGRVAERPQRRMSRLGALLSETVETLRQWLRARISTRTWVQLSRPA